MTHRLRLGRQLACLALVFAVPAAARAQSVSDVLGFLVTNQSVQTGDFERDRSAAQATRDTISRALLANLATLPLTSSSGAFVYRLNSTLGTEQQATGSFGPVFVQRALTAGDRQVSVGLTFQELHFTSLDGHSLRDGSLVTTANQFVDEAAPFDQDRLTLNIDASVATLYANLGVTDRVEFGVIAPMITLRVDGSRINTYRGQTFTQARASATAIGLADIALRTKVLLYEDEGTGLAATVDVRLPTGRQADLLGTGTTSLKLAAVGSLEGRWVSTHANLGYTLGGLDREVSYGGAVSVNVSRRLTANTEILGRWINGIGHIVSSSAPDPGLAGVDTIRLLADSSSVNVIAAMPGLKWNLGDTWVLAASVGVPLTHDGLTAPFTPFLGLDYAFGR